MNTKESNSIEELQMELTRLENRKTIIKIKKRDLDVDLAMIELSIDLIKEKISKLTNISYDDLAVGTKILFKDKEDNNIQAVIISNFKYYDILNLNNYIKSDYNFECTQELIEKFCKDNNYKFVKVLQLGEINKSYKEVKL